MKVETRELPDSEVEFSFEVEDERVERAMNVAYKHLAGHVNIAGFRRGKAPRALVERTVGREALVDEALNHLLPEVFEEALLETRIVALTEPQFDVEGMNPLRAKAVVVVQPAVELGDYRAIRREIAPVVISDEDIDKVFEELRESHAEWVPVERPAEMGDLLAIDVKGVTPTRTVVDQQDVNYVLRPENTAPVPGFAEALVGAAATETRNFTLTVPKEEDESATEEMITFDVTVKDIKVKELPEADDTFAATVGEYEDLAALKARIQANLQAQGEVTARRSLETEIIDEALAQATVTIPAKLIEQQAQRLLERLAQDLDNARITIDQYLQITQSTREMVQERMNADGEQVLRRSFVLRNIAAAEGVAVTDEEVELGIRESLAAEGGDARAISRAVQRPEIRERVRNSMLESRAARWLIDAALGTPSAEPNAAIEPEDQPLEVGAGVADA